MKLYEKYSEGGYHSSIASTFNVDFDAYETIVLSRLRGTGCRNNMLLCDSRMVTASLDGAFRLPRYAGRLYSVSGAQGERAGGVFHPKLLIQLGRQKGRLLIGSANLTASGIAGNLEIVSELRATAEPSGEREILRQAFDYLLRHLDHGDPTVEAQLEFMRRRTPWLSETEPALGAVSLADKTLAAFLASGADETLADRLVGLVHEPIHRLIIISPYWDEQLAALQHLTSAWKPAEVSVLVDKEVTAFPPLPPTLSPMLRLFDRGKAFKSRFIHAKVIIAQGASADHVLFGSANCTLAALGAGGIPGINAEASLYRRLPPGSALTELDLTEVFSSEPLSVADIPKRELPEDELELERLASAHPGAFQILGDQLSWRPSLNYAKVACDLTLQDQRGEEIIVDLVLLQSDGPVRRYRVSALPPDAAPVFARAKRPDEQWSSPAIITYPQDIQIASRERGLRQLEQALTGLEDTSVASLQTLEIFDLLRRLDQADQGGESAAFVPRAHREAKDAGGTYNVLTYEEFLNSRQDAGAQSGKSHHTTLAGSSHFSVRSVLNRLLGGAGEAVLEVEDEDAGVHDLTQNDEAPDEVVPDSGSTSHAGGATAEPTPSLDEIELARRRSRRAERDRLLKAVSQFQMRLKEKQETGSIDTIEMLRVRLMLMIICQAAYSADGKAVKRLPPDKVLAAEDSRNGWTDIVGRLIFALIHGANSPLRQLYFQNINGQVPVDLLECWATCYWCAQACFAAPVSAAQRQHMEKYLRPYIVALYQLTLPSEAELLGETVLDIMDRMSAVYGPAMGVGSVAEAHRASVKAAI
ncbi:hypothetical protein HNQ36_002693 [Afipia massiliensis]|uniref:Phospholipase D-like domain-containing protein n=1 Tax=Afipia massiliensis TaxID=211460 RepID=A0A840MWL7_9BRAD|nr:hypothetical protein [Afipia massiliensis]MBB5052719.1 hypothetical protein [Afipia massiliensis]